MTARYVCRGIFAAQGMERRFRVGLFRSPQLSRLPAVKAADVLAQPASSEIAPIEISAATFFFTDVTTSSITSELS